MLGITFIRKIYNMTTEELGSRIGVSKQAISKWENGKSIISKRNLKMLSQLFKMPADVFQKDLTEIDELEVQKMKMNNEINFIDEVNMFDPETADEIDNLNFEIKKRQLISKIDESFKNCRTEQELLIKYLDSFLDILFSDDVKDRTAIRDTIGALKKYYGLKGGIMPNRFVRDIIHALEEREREKKKR